MTDKIHVEGDNMDACMFATTRSMKYNGNDTRKDVMQIADRWLSSFS